MDMGADIEIEHRQADTCDVDGRAGRNVTAGCRQVLDPEQRAGRLKAGSTLLEVEGQALGVSPRHHLDAVAEHQASAKGLLQMARRGLVSSQVQDQPVLDVRSLEDRSLGIGCRDDEICFTQSLASLRCC